jgi:ABC-type glutathione transport system ATPase component
MGLAVLLITHDLAIVSVADRVGVMYLGRLFEVGPVASVIAQPRHPYTRMFVSAVPLTDPGAARARSGPRVGEPPRRSTCRPAAIFTHAVPVRCHIVRRSSPSGAKSRRATASPVTCIHDCENRSMTVAGAWASYCRRTASAALASDVEARARLCVADHLHAAMHGAHSDTAALLRRYLGWGSSGGAAATDAESAALYSGDLGRA